MPDKQFTDYINERSTEEKPSRLLDYFLLRKADGSVKKTNIFHMNSGVQIDPVGISVAGTVDLNPVLGTVGTAVGTADISVITLDSGEIRKITFSDTANLINSENLILPGKKDILILPGDKITFFGRDDDVVEVTGYIPASAQTIQRVTYIVDSTGNITPDCDTTDICSVETQNADTTLHIISGTPRDEQPLQLHLYAPDEEVKVLSFNLSGYRFIGVRPPAVLNGVDGVAGGLTRIYLAYNLQDGIWDVIDVKTEGVLPWTTDVAGSLDEAQFTSSLYTDDAITTYDTKVVSAKTSNYTVVANTDHNKIFTNFGSSGLVTFTLPALSGAIVGKTRHEFRNVAANSIAIKVLGSDHMLGYIGSAIDITGGTSLTASGKGSVLIVECNDSTHWTITTALGNWS